MRNYNADMQIVKLNNEIRKVINKPNTEMVLVSLKSWLNEYSKTEAWQLYESIASGNISKSLLEEISKRSYLHGNGFAKIVLVDNPHFKCRLHVWRNSNTGVETLHNHRWSFASAIQAGAITADIFNDSVKPEAEYFKEYVYQREGASTSTSMLIGDSRLERIITEVKVAGDTYHMDCNTIHRITGVESPITATLFVQLSANRSWNRLITKRHENAPSMNRLVVDEKTLQLILKALLVN